MDDDWGKSVAKLLREGGREQYEETQKFVLQSLWSGDRVCGDIIMQVIWALLPEDAQEKIARRER